MTGPRLNFSEIGERFLGHILTPELLRRELIASIPPDGLKAVETVAGYSVQYDAVVGEVRVVRQEMRRFYPPALQGYRFRFSIAFQLRLKVNILQGLPLPPALGLNEAFSVNGLIPLVLEAQVHEPLTLLIHYQPLSADQIELSTEKAQWHDLAMRFGGLEQKIRQQVVRRVNTMLEDNIKVRTIDLYGLAESALAARGSALAGKTLPGSGKKLYGDNDGSSGRSHSKQ